MRGAKPGVRDVFGGLRGEAEHAGAGPARHCGNAAVIEVDDRGSAFREGLDQFALGNGDVVDSAEFTGMGGADAQDHADPGPDHVREIADVADAGGAHLDHQVAGVEAGLEDGQRYTHLAVVGALGRNGVAFRGEDSGEQVLGGGLAGGSGDADDGEAGALGLAAGPDPADGFGGQCAHGEDSVLDHDGGIRVSGIVVNVTFHQGQDGAAFKGRTDEVVAVSGLAGLRHIEGTRRGLPGIRDHRERA